MNDFVINLFVPHTQEGSSSAIIAHMYAYAKQGMVSIVRCKNNEEAEQKIQELLHHITMADGYNAPQPDHREVWIVGFSLKEMIQDELDWFIRYKTGRIVRNVSTSEDLYTQITSCDFPISLGFYMGQSSLRFNSYAILRTMLDAEEYEHLMAYLLRKHPSAADVTKEDYVLNLFVEHKKKYKE